MVAQVGVVVGEQDPARGAPPGPRPARPAVGGLGPAQPPVRLLDVEAGVVVVRLRAGPHVDDPVGRQVGRAERDGDRERAAHARARCCAFAVPPCSSASSRTRARPMPGALVAARPGAGDPVEPVEEQPLLVGGHADAGVGDLQHAPRRGARRAGR